MIYLKIDNKYYKYLLSKYSKMYIYLYYSELSMEKDIYM